MRMHHGPMVGCKVRGNTDVHTMYVTEIAEIGLKTYRICEQMMDRNEGFKYDPNWRMMAGSALRSIRKILHGS